MDELVPTAPVWLGEAASKRQTLIDAIAMSPDFAFERLQPKACSNLKHAHVNFAEHKQTGIAAGKDTKLVQEETN